MPKDETIELGHLETLLDVVFGIIIAFPLLDLPVLITNSFAEPSPVNKDIVSIFLLLSSLIFASYYWLEVRHFIRAQREFNKAINSVKETNNEGVPLSLAPLFVGSLLMMILGAGILQFSKYSAFKTFLIFNLTFWIADLGGTLILKSEYKKFKGSFDKKSSAFREQHIWFTGHFISNFFLVYGLVNVSVYTSLFIVDQFIYASLISRLLISIFILGFVLFRHFYWRSTYYSNWIREKLSTKEEFA